MSVQLESVERINALKNGIEAVTGESYDNLTAGVQALKNGYGQGGGDVIDLGIAVGANSMFMKTHIKTFPVKNTSNIMDFRQTFYECDFTEAELDLTSCKDMRNCFYSCDKLITLTLQNTRVIPSSSYWEACFKECYALINLSIDYLIVTGNHIDFSDCKNLSVESLVNILNALSDNTGVSTTYTVKLGATNLAKLTAEQKQIATNKNIALA